jgi:hypothetical protein
MQHRFQRESWKYIPLNFVKPCSWAPSSPCLARVPFCYMIVLFNKIKPVIFFSASTTSHQLSECASIQQCCFTFIFIFWFYLRHSFLHLQPSPTTSSDEQKGEEFCALMRGRERPTLGQGSRKHQKVCTHSAKIPRLDWNKAHSHPAGSLTAVGTNVIIRLCPDGYLYPTDFIPWMAAWMAFFCGARPPKMAAGGSLVAFFFSAFAKFRGLETPPRCLNPPYRSLLVI